MAKRSMGNLKSLALTGMRVRVPPPANRCGDDDDCAVDARAIEPQKTRVRGLHPPSHPPASFRDRVAEAFGVSADELVAIVRRMVRRASGGVTHDLDDAVQETLCRLLAVDAGRFDSTRALEGFVALRARWTLMDGRRRQGREGRALARHLANTEALTPSVEVDAIDSEEAAASAGTIAALAVAFDALPDDDRALLQAHDVDGASLRTLAGQMGVNVSTLSRRRRLALRRLARLVEV